MDDKLYMVQINLGSSDHPIIILDQEGPSDKLWSECGDYCFDPFKAGEVIDNGGIIQFASPDREEAENFKAGVDVMRTMLRRWIDS